MGDRGLPQSPRFMNGYGSHAYFLINAENERVWVMFHFKTEQGIKFFTNREAEAVREPFQGYWQTSDYGYWDSLDGNSVQRALAEMKLKSEIARPRVLRNPLAEPDLHGLRRCMGRRNRRNEDRCKL